ncbi:hypothetical protein ACFVMC_32590 [Nocardia sp. NPDC127579]|uniref:hypothetical protein n=1 Tax=Nocardia sp. NPDC127579 TaxID=3345402 RepID=UPI003624B413
MARSAVTILTAGALALGLTTACGDSDPAEIAAEASEFGGIVLPEGATVLGTRKDEDRTTLYRLTLSTDPEGVRHLLSASTITAPPERAFEVGETTIAGPPLETSPMLLRVADDYQRPDGKSIARIVIVDERDPGLRYVHIQLSDT